MTPDEVIQECQRAGLTLRAVGDGIGVKPKSRLTAALADKIREHRAKLLLGLQAPETPSRKVFEYELADKPGVWLIMIGRPGADLKDARARLEWQFGADRVVNVRVRGEDHHGAAEG
ncbi:MAG: hypothetical protein U5R46_12015 [Gammaproteobacteria bacterium]|nr:hypothetical protein [Gammaproteobacteria bacterium]